MCRVYTQSPTWLLFRRQTSAIRLARPECAVCVSEFSASARSVGVTGQQETKKHCSLPDGCAYSPSFPASMRQWSMTVSKNAIIQIRPATGCQRGLKNQETTLSKDSRRTCCVVLLLCERCKRIVWMCCRLSFRLYIVFAFQP